MSEIKLQKECMDLLKKMNIFFWRNNIGTTKGRVTKNPAAGSPDVIAIIGGIFYGFEFKSKKGKLSDSQIAWHDRAIIAGARIFVIRSVDELINVLPARFDNPDSGFIKYH